ncbi:MAG: DMT family transporter [Fimbriimonadales bacterium]
MLSAKTLLLTAFTLIAFAANSILCRLALGTREIDPASFTTLRLVSGAAVLAVIVAVRNGRISFKVARVKPQVSSGMPHGSGFEVPNSKLQTPNWSSWLSGVMLFAYAAAFSFAYLGLKAGTGALILFGSVQATMILAAIFGGHRPRPLEWIGLAVALGGLLYLVVPGLAAPPIMSAALMAVAGVAWGVYSLRGRGVSDPTAATASNFLRAAPFAVVLSLVLIGREQGSASGFGWAALSGGVTSGLGYVLWYAALPGLGPTRAAVVQLAVPVLAAAGGVLLLGEELTMRLTVASAITLSGVAIAVFGRAGSDKAP